MDLINDNSCGWTNQLPERSNIKLLDQDIYCDYLIVGAGYTGLSAARKLSDIKKDKKIVLIDAQLAGEGGISRNSGYLVDTTLNDGFTSNSDKENYVKKTKIYHLGIEAVRKFIKEYQVDCDWNECGKYFASSKEHDEAKAQSFSKLLNSLGFKNKILFNKELTEKLGTPFYKIGVFTSGGILLNPGKLARAMVETLPDNVKVYENSQINSWKKINNKIECFTKKNKITTKKIIFCTNGFLKFLKVKKNYSFPITLTASLTRQLTDKEFKDIGSPKEWGVLPIRPMGATIRFTRDRRLLIRNTAEMKNPNSMSKYELEKRKLLHLKGLIKRFPTLKTNLIEDSWYGIVSRSRNSSQIFEMIEKNIYVAGCYNGSGIGVGTLFGEQIAIMASDQQSNEIEIINKRAKPNWLPPSPILNLGVQTRLFFERLRAKSEI